MAKQGTNTIPIVAVSPADAVAIGLVANLARPGAHVTGLSYLGTELIPKQMEFLKETVPNLSRMAALSNPANPTHAPRLRAAEIAAKELRVTLERVEVRTPSELNNAFVTMTRARVRGVLVLSDPMFAAEAGRLAQIAIQPTDQSRDSRGCDTAAVNRCCAAACCRHRCGHPTARADGRSRRMLDGSGDPGSCDRRSNARSSSCRRLRKMKRSAT